MARKRTKYTLRKDGRIVLSDTINGERKYFYGKTDKEVEQKRDDYIRECEKHANEAAGKGRTFEAVADDWWEQCEPRLSPNTVCGYRTAKNRAVDAFGKTPTCRCTPPSCMKASGAWWVSSCCSGTSKSGNSTATSPMRTGMGQRNLLN